MRYAVLTVKNAFSISAYLLRMAAGELERVSLERDRILNASKNFEQELRALEKRYTDLQGRLHKEAQDKRMLLEYDLL